MKRPYYVIVLAALLGVASYVIAVFFHSIIFQGHAFLEMLLTPDPAHILEGLTFVTQWIIFGIVVSILMGRQMKIERALRSSNTELEIYTRIMRHDLKNDIQAIVYNAELAAMLVQGDDEFGQSISTVVASAERMDQVLSLSLGSRGKTNSIGSLLDGVSELAMKAHAGLIVAVHSFEDMDNVEITNMPLLPLVFHNLLKNSARHAGEHPEVTITLSKCEKYCQIDIADNGPGVASEILPILFEESASTTGGGLGLHLSRKIVQSYGGSMTLLQKDTSDVGAVFRIEIPLDVD
ncbi:MAG: HAMP domain-containing histidine kinase [Candidatus Thorarchaeota archaeon]|nr:MAG: HAMP domain-containing histidine kinase [Candidatus Thorarchaeota archaeon]